MKDKTAEQIARLHKIIDQAFQADLRGSMTIHYGGRNRVVIDFNLGLTDTEVLHILEQRTEQKKLRVEDEH